MSVWEQRIIESNNRADLLRKQGKTSQALLLFEEAIKLISSYGASPYTEASVYTNYGLLLCNLGKYTLAVEYQKKALELDELTGEPRNLGFSHHNLGLALLGANKQESGIKHLEKARVIRHSIRDYSELLYTLEILGDAYIGINDLKRASRCAKQGLKLCKKISYGPEFRGIVALSAKTAILKGQVAKACALESEVVKLLEQMRQRYHDIENLDLYDRRYNKRYLEAIELFLEAKKYDKALVLIDRTRFRSGRDALDGVQSFDALPNKDTMKIPHVEKGELILMAWTYPKYTWVFPIRHGVEKIAPDKIVTSTREGPIKILDVYTEWEEHFNTLLRQWQCIIDFYKTDIDSINRLILIPHGTGWQIPSACLQYPRMEEFLLNKKKLFISPSLRFCDITDRRQRFNSKKYLVIGDPTGDLENAKEEAELIARKLGCKPVLGSDAKKDFFLETISLEEFDIIHYAGHGTYTDYGLHALNFADGLVTVNEVISAKPKANIVNLISCWSGMTGFSVWNELHGFVRALLLSGVRNVISSVYPTHDKASKMFSLSFYDDYLKSKNTLKAFQSGINSICYDFDKIGWGGLYLTGQR